MENLHIPHNGVPNSYYNLQLFERMVNDSRNGKDFDVYYYSSEEEWRDARANGIGASEAATVFGMTDGWKTRKQLFNEKLGSSPTFKGNDLTVLGQRCEPLIRELWALEHPEFDVYDGTNIIFRSVKRPWQTCSLDMVLIHRDTGKIFIGEIKTGLVTDKKWHTGYCPDNYFLQVCHQLSVTCFDGVLLTARLRRPEMSISDKAIENTFFYSYHDTDIQNEINSINKEEDSFWEDVKRGVLRPKMNTNFF